MRKFVATLSILLLLAVPLVAHAASARVTTDDVVGVWVNHRDQDIHQQITFTKNHHWRENQHGQRTFTRVPGRLPESMKLPLHHTMK